MFVKIPTSTGDGACCSRGGVSSLETRCAGSEAEGSSGTNAGDHFGGDDVPGFLGKDEGT